MEIDYSRIKLDLYSKNLTKLPDDITKYINLIELNCSNNKITSLDNLPPGLQKLDCINNPLQYDFAPTIENIKNNKNNNNVSSNTSSNTI